jgi:DNA replication and repair protein RecF
MNPNVRIEKITLINFRNHKNTNISNLRPFIVLTGENGSGKTNLLEAISLFAPGRGLKNAQLNEIPFFKNSIGCFEIKLEIRYDTGNIILHRYFSDENKRKNFVTLDEEKINNSELLNYLNILWVTPVMEKIMLQSNSEKRSFFDRLNFNVNNNHLKNLSKLQKLLKERLTLLKKVNYEFDWMSILENKIAEISFVIINDRIDFIKILNRQLSKIKKPFTSCFVEFKHELDSLDQFISNKEMFVSKYSLILEAKRELDAELNKTTHTINKVNISIWNKNNHDIEAKNCSTGEQKSILLSVIISVAHLVKNKHLGRSPILLLDEAMAHLDDIHKEYLFKELSKLESQVLFSGVSRDLFNNITDQTVFFEMKNII